MSHSQLNPDSSWDDEPTKKDKNPSLIQSEWRKQIINGDYNQELSLDDLRKVRVALRKKYPDHEIMECYGINAETLIAVKQDIYVANSSIALYRLNNIQIGKKTKMNLDYLKLENAVYSLTKALELIGDTLFIDFKDNKLFRDVLVGKTDYSKPYNAKKKPGVKKKDILPD